MRPDADVRRLYPRFRWQILEATFLGYATFYLVRNNLSPVMKEMAADLHYTNAMTGDLLAATAIAYGLGKFVMGIVSDRSNPRLFMPAGLALTALFNVLFGFSSSHVVHLMLWTANGFIQGMGWPPCGRSLGHWFSLRERGTYFAIWNTAHNIGGAAAGALAAYSATLFGWRSAFLVPAGIAAVGALYLLWRLRDTPQSVGLPAIEDYDRWIHPDVSPFHASQSVPIPHDTAEQERTVAELLFEDVLSNGKIWLFALANFFVYIVRYGLLDWGPTYLKTAKGADLMTGGGWSTAIYELAGVGSTVLMGWLSDRWGGRRGLVSFLCMLPISLAFLGIYLNPPGHLWVDLFCFAVIGFFVYPPVMLLGVTGLDFTSKKAVGTAAGFIGLAGYLGRTTEGKLLGLLADGTGGWNDAMLFLAASLMAAIMLLGFTWNLKPKR